MAMSNRERIERALSLLREGLAPCVERELEPALKAGRIAEDRPAVRRGDPQLQGRPPWEGDALFLLKVMNEVWNEVFQGAMGPLGRSMVNELQDWGSQWAQQKAFTSDDTVRVLDTAQRLLDLAGAGQQAQEVDRLRQELLRQIYEEQRRTEARKRADLGLETPAGLRPWREVITPHDDVISGQFQLAEFAADLWQVYRGEGAVEYLDPREFFRRTHLTDSLRRLLINAVRRLAGREGDPVIQLQTNFGGGKTHSLLALYHLFGLEHGGGLAELDDLLREAGPLPEQQVKRVVIVGNRLSPGSPDRKKDGTQVRTLWGEIAWQLGGAEGYRLVAEDDLRATSPGDALRTLLARYAPCMILIDEWVAYARQLPDQNVLPGGTLETQITFAQTLTESVRLVPGCLLVISLPASGGVGSPHTRSRADEMELGGTRGEAALNGLRHIIGRVESFWRPASMEESFLIVRKRLFNPLLTENFRYRDDTARTFMEYYRQNKADFPRECTEPYYEQRIRDAYPIHPEVFDRLYTDWAALPRFQRTRGVLRFMALVIHALWESEDQAPLILPCSLPLDRERIQSEINRQLEERWAGVLESDVDGSEAISGKIDSEHTNLGRLHAARRVARTVFFGSAPTLSQAHKGLDEPRIKLGCAMPGDSLPHFSDALRRLKDRAHHLYAENARYWFDVRPTLVRVARDLAEQLRKQKETVLETVEEELRSLVTREVRSVGIQAVCCPRSSGDIADDRNFRLVILGPEKAHARNRTDSPALVMARELLEKRSETLQRQYRNTLVFLAPDENQLTKLFDAACMWLAWKQIQENQGDRELTLTQIEQVRQMVAGAQETLQRQLRECWTWLLVPEQTDPAEVTFRPISVTMGEQLLKRAVRKLQDEELLVGQLNASTLRKDLDRVPLWRGNDVAVRQLLDDYASYLYLHRLEKPEVLLRACEQGINTLSWELDGFACADCYDEAQNRYRNLRVRQKVELTEDTTCLLVKPEVARHQIQAEASPAAVTDAAALQEAVPRTAYGSGADTAGRPPAGTGADAWTAAAPAQVYRRVQASRRIDPLSVAREIVKIDEEVLKHLKTAGGNLQITLEIHAELPQGLSEDAARTIRENCRDLGIQLHLEQD